MVLLILFLLKAKTPLLTRGPRGPQFMEPSPTVCPVAAEASSLARGYAASVSTHGRCHMPCLAALPPDVRSGFALPSGSVYRLEATPPYAAAGSRRRLSPKSILRSSKGQSPSAHQATRKSLVSGCVHTNATYPSQCFRRSSSKNLVSTVLRK